MNWPVNPNPGMIPNSVDIKPDLTQIQMGPSKPISQAPSKVIEAIKSEPGGGGGGKDIKNGIIKSEPMDRNDLNAPSESKKPRLDNGKMADIKAEPKGNIFQPLLIPFDKYIIRNAKFKARNKG